MSGKTTLMVQKLTNMLCLVFLFASSFSPACAGTANPDCIKAAAFTVDGKQRIRIRGFMVLDYLGSPEKPAMVLKGKTLTVKFKLYSRSNGKAYHCFDLEFGIPSGIEKVCFGNNKKIVWPESPPKLSASEELAYQLVLSDLNTEHINLDWNAVACHIWSKQGNTNVKLFDHDSAKTYIYCVDTELNSLIGKRVYVVDPKLSHPCKKVVLP